MLNCLFPLRVLVAQVPVIIVWNDNTFILCRKFHNEPIIIADNASAILQFPWRRVHHYSFTLQAEEDFLVCHWGFLSRHFFAPLRHEHINLFVAPLLKELYTKLDSLAGKDVLMAMTDGEKNTISIISVTLVINSLDGFTCEPHQWQFSK